MFSALSQGSPVYILDKTSSLEYKTGEVVGVSIPRFSNFGNVVDLKVRVGDSIEEFTSVPSINSTISYDNGKVIVSETKLSIQNEIEQILQNRTNILNNIDRYREEIAQCEDVLKKLSPQFAVDKERDERLSSLESRFGNVESKLDKIFNLILK